MRFEYAFLEKYTDYWQVSELANSFYFLFISLPGLIFSTLFAIMKEVSNIEFFILISSLIYSFGTFLLIGDPRYALLVMPVFI
tara:strand:- start:97 stop:345 length:249 start_codon:yes stop_codon:yes gene_type:complete